MQPDASRPVEGANPSLWQTTADVPPRPALDADATVDVCVVGAGIAGLTTAYTLARAGRSVVVLDDGPGRRRRDGAHDGARRDVGRRLLPRGRAHARRGDRAARRRELPCGGRPHRADRARRVDRLRLSAARRLVVRGRRRTASGAARARSTTRRAPPARGRRARRRLAARDAHCPTRRASGPALRFPRQAQFHALRYLAGLARAVERHGGRIFAGAHVARRRGRDERRAAAWSRPSGGRTVRARARRRRDEHADQRPLRRCTRSRRRIARTSCGLRVRRGELPAGLVLGHARTLPLRAPVRPERRRTPTTCSSSAARTTRRGRATTRRTSRFAAARGVGARALPGRRRRSLAGVVRSWSRSTTWRYIGRNPGERHVWIVTGDSGNGITHGTIAGMLLPELIAGARVALGGGLRSVARLGQRGAGVREGEPRTSPRSTPTS